MEPHQTLADPRGWRSVPPPPPRPVSPASTSLCSDWQPTDCVSTNLLGRRRLLVCSSQASAWWAGLRSIVLLSQRISRLASLPPFIKWKQTPELYALMASRQVLKCHFWGSASFPGRVQPSGETSSSFPHPRWCWWAFASSHPPQRGPGFFDTALAFTSSKL